MANVMRYDPFDLLEGVMKSVLRPGWEAASQSQSQPSGNWGGTIPIDATEDDRIYTVVADLPGVKKEDVSVSIKGNQVTLSAELKREKPVEQGQGKETVLCTERASGTLSRTIQFAADIDDSKAEAHYRDGVLTLKLPKKESAQVKRLSIH